MSHWKILRRLSFLRLLSDCSINALQISAEASGFACFGTRDGEVTHTFNVQVLHHRECGLANVALLPTFPATPLWRGLRPPTVEIIADGEHVAPLALHLLLSSRGRDVAEAPWSIAEWAAALRFENPRATVLVLL